MAFPPPSFSNPPGPEAFLDSVRARWATLDARYQAIQESIQQKEKEQEMVTGADDNNSLPTGETYHPPGATTESPDNLLSTILSALNLSEEELSTIPGTEHLTGHYLVPTSILRDHQNRASSNNIQDNEEHLANNEALASYQATEKEDGFTSNEGLASYQVIDKENPFDDSKEHPTGSECSHSDTHADLPAPAPSLETITNDSPNPLAADPLPAWDLCAHAFDPNNPDMDPELARPIWTVADHKRKISRVEQWLEFMESKRGTEEMEWENVMCRGIWIDVDVEVEDDEAADERRRIEERCVRYPTWKPACPPIARGVSVEDVVETAEKTRKPGTDAWN